MPHPALPPAVWQSLQFEWLWVYRGDVPHVETWSDPITVPAGWFQVERGLAQIETGGHLVSVKPGQAYFSAPGTRRQWFAPGTRLLSVGLRCLTPGGLPLFQDGLNLVVSAAASNTLHKATLALFHAVNGRKRLVTFKQAIAPAARSLASWCDHEAAFRDWFRVYLSCLQRFGIQPASAHHCANPKLNRLLTALDEWPLNQPLRLLPLARQSGLSERRARDLLRARLGMTPQAWLDRRRLDSAKTALMSDSPPVKEIAFALGFRHAPHFTVWFKRSTSLTPTAFRLAHAPFEAA